MTVPLKAGDRIEFIGDSITDCHRRDDHEFGLGNGYVSVIASALRPAGIDVINRGISGNRTADLVARWRPDCLDLAPNVLSIMIGINDTWHRYGHNNPTSVDSFEQNYRALITAVVEELDAHIILIEPWLLPVSEEQQAWRKDLDPKIDAVNSLATEFGLTLLPLDAIMTRRAEIDTATAVAADGVHPTPLGHQVIADAWLELVTISRASRTRCPL